MDHAYKIRLGILGPGRIVRRVMMDLHLAEHIRVTAVASRDLKKAEEAAKAYGAEYAYGSYEEMAEADTTDLIYVAVPHPFHEACTCLMMQHKKHVIVEKPAALNDKQVERMLACARENGVFFMEAMWSHFLPAMVKMTEMVKNGAIGDVRNIYATFLFPGRIDVTDRVYNLSLGGGALLDVGVYPLMPALTFLGKEPEKIQALMQLSEEGIDLRTVAQLLYKNGATAQFVSGMDALADNTLVISGTEGMVRMPGYVAPTTFTVVRPGKEPETYTFDRENQGFHHEFEHAALCILEGRTSSPVMTWEETLSSARICRIMRQQNGLIYPQEKDEIF